MKLQISKRRLYQIGAVATTTVGLYNLIGGILVFIEGSDSINQHVRMLIGGASLLILTGFLIYKACTVPDQQITLCGRDT